MNYKKVFEDAANLLENKGWCKYYFSIDKYGTSVRVDDPRAASFCILGAIKNVSGVGDGCLPTEFFTVFRPHFPTSLAKWNDYFAESKEEVIEKLREISRKL